MSATQSANPTAWQRDRQINAHYLPAPGGYYVVVKSPGDYYAGFNPENDPCIDGDLEYFDTLKQAKAWCEKSLLDMVPA